MTTIPTQRIYEGYLLAGDRRVFFVRHFGTFLIVGCSVGTYQPLYSTHNIIPLLYLAKHRDLAKPLSACCVWKDLKCVVVVVSSSSSSVIRSY